nr:DUF4376 domain-containing protein [Chromohalobacter nigrandesensis]
MYNQKNPVQRRQGPTTSSTHGASLPPFRCIPAIHNADPGEAPRHRPVIRHRQRGELRGKSNKTRMLTPEEMIKLTTAALDHIERIYKRSWDRKDAVADALENEDREGVEAVAWLSGA